MPREGAGRAEHSQGNPAGAQQGSVVPLSGMGTAGMLSLGLCPVLTPMEQLLYKYIFHDYKLLRPSVKKPQIILLQLLED